MDKCNKRRFFTKEKPIFLVGNKKDLEDKRVITKAEGEKLAKENDIMFSECSAKTGENVDIIFNELINKCYNLLKQNIGDLQKLENYRLSENKSKKNCVVF